nr:pentapeptide repeat-containing protein [Bordetella sp. 15P40C-2]
MNLAAIQKASFERCEFGGASLAFADFSYSRLHQCGLEGVTLNRTKFHRLLTDSDSIKTRLGAIERDDELFEAELRSASSP